jgi:Zinc carboxypeptidase
MGRRFLLGVLLALFLSPVAIRGFAFPTCPGSDRTLCGGRIIPEAMQSTGFLTYDEWIGAMTALQTEHPNRVKFDNIGMTAAGRPLYDVIVTDFADPTQLSSRTGLYFNGDIHGDERDGTEGFARVIEDLAETTDGTLSNDLKHLVLVFTDANPDGWQVGDYDFNPPNTGTFTRANGAGHDLNREWPVVGFQNPTTFPLTDPEVQSIVQTHGNHLHRDLGINFAYGYDVHGSATFETPPTAQLMLDVLLSAGELDLKRSMLQTQLFSQYMANLSATTSDNILAEIGGATGQQIYRVGDWDTSWDIYGYLVSGGYADWQANQWTGLGAVTGTIELWINGEPGQENTFGGFNQTVEASNVHSMRVAVRTAMDVALQPQQAALKLAGPIAYVSNDFALQQGDGTGSTTLPTTPPPANPPPGRPYPASTDQFFRDLGPFADHPITALAASAITDASQLAGYADVVVAQDPHLSDAPFLTALRNYAEAGGTVILTDGAFQDLAAMGLVPSSAVGSDLVYAGYVDVNQSDPLGKGLHSSLSRQTYEPVPVGYPIDNTFSSSTSTVHSPAWWVDQTTWEAAGGRTAGTTGTSKTSLGELPIGTGRIRILGSMLPDPSGDAAHPFGVSDYSVTYVGYKLFENLLDASASLFPPIVENGPLTTNPTPEPAPSVPEAPLAPLVLVGALPTILLVAHGRRRRQGHPG